MKRFLGLILFLSSASFAQTPGLMADPLPQRKPLLKVVTTLTVLASLVKEIGGEWVEVVSLSSAEDDPHFVKAKPTFKRAMSEADLFVQIGRSLELWAPTVITASANAKLNNDSILIASLGVKALEVPSALTRERGDIHPQGNPHVWLSPAAALKMAENIKNSLMAKDNAHKAQFEAGFLSFKKRLSEAMFGIDLVKRSGSMDFLWRLHEGKKLQDYLVKRKMSVGGFIGQMREVKYSPLTYHTVWSYFADDFGLNIFGQIEERSGVAPSLRYQNDLVSRAKAAGIKHVIAASYYRGNAKLINLIAGQLSGKAAFIDVDCRRGESYIDMMSRIIKELIAMQASPVKKAA